MFYNHICLYKKKNNFTGCILQNKKKKSNYINIVGLLKLKEITTTYIHQLSMLAFSYQIFLSYIG